MAEIADLSTDGMKRMLSRQFSHRPGVCGIGAVRDNNADSLSLILIVYVDNPLSPLADEIRTFCEVRHHPVNIRSKSEAGFL